MNNLKKYQKIRDSCDFCKDTPNKGLMCFHNKKEMKCCLNNCPSLPLIIQNKKTYSLPKVNAVSVNENKCLKFHNKGHSYKEIANKLNMSKTMAYKNVVNAKRKLNILMVNDKPIGERKLKKKVNDNKHKIRLHNDEIKLKAIINWKSIKAKIIPLNYTEYKFIKTETTQIKVFQNDTITIRFLEDIKADTADVAKLKADKRLYYFLNNFRIKGIILPKNQPYKQINRHYALLEANIADKYITERKTLITHDWLDGKVRERIDFSQSEGKCRAEIDAEHTLKGKTDIERTKAIVEDFENNDVDLMSTTKSKINDIYALLLRTEKILNNSVELQNIQIKKEFQNDKEIKKTETIPDYVG